MAQDHGAAFLQQIANVWARWNSQQHDNRSSDVVDTETQYELLTMGLVATLTDEQLHFLAGPESVANGRDFLLTFVLNWEDDYARDAKQFHFTLVVAVKLLEERVRRQHDVNNSNFNTAVPRPVVTMLLSLLRFQRYQLVHRVALTMLKRLFDVFDSKELCEVVGDQLYAMLMQEVVPSTDGFSNTQVERTDDDNKSADSVSYVSLCNVVQVLLQEYATSDTESCARERLLGQIQDIFVKAVGSYNESPSFLRAISMHLVPSVVQINPEMIGNLASLAAETWQTASTVKTNNTSTLLYLVCLLMPRDPTLVCNVGLQHMISFALAQEDSLMRKQGMYALKIALSHYTLEASTSSHEAEIWQSFITASEVIQMHQEQHLIEQVWPQVEHLIDSSLVSVQETLGSSPLPSSWPVRFSFEWIQSLLVRVFSHDNPVVRRLFLSNFMTTCANRWRPALQSGNQKKSRAISQSTIDPGSSLACEPSFHKFVFHHLLHTVNDPMLYKSSNKEAFQSLLTKFLALYLTFQLSVYKKTHDKTNSDESTQRGLLNDYVNAVHEAIFGEAADGHSPEALLSMLQVFQDDDLQSAMKTVTSANCLLDEAAVDQLRFIINVHVVQSFPHAIRVKTFAALQNVLTGGFTPMSVFPLRSLARILLVFPANSLTACNGTAFLSILRWLSTDHDCEEKFRRSVSQAVCSFLKKKHDNNHDPGMQLSAEQLSRLLLFTAELGDDIERKSATLRLSFALLTEGITKDEVDDCQLILLVGKIEEEISELIEATHYVNGIGSDPQFRFDFKPSSFYYILHDGNDRHKGEEQPFSCFFLFHTGLTLAQKWLKNAQAASTDDDGPSAEDEENEHAIMASSATVMTQMATYSMEEVGDLRCMNELNTFCNSLKLVVSGDNATNANKQTIAMRFLAIVSAQTKAIDSLEVFQGATMLPFLHDARLTRRAHHGSKQLSRCTVVFSTNKWMLIYHTLLASSYVPTSTLHDIFMECLDSLSAAGTDPYGLLQMVHVLSLSLKQLAATFIADAKEEDTHLDALFQAVWGAYSDCKSKPDVLTRAVVYCLFQPAFLVSRELSEKEDSLIKRWFHKFLRFGEVHRPNVVFHLTCRMCQIWRALPHAALWFVEEIAALVLYKEPIIDEKEQLTMNTGVVGSNDSHVQHSRNTTGLQVKNKFVRLIVLSFLDEVCIDTTTAEDSSSEKQLMNALILHLLALNLTEEWQKPHMINSDGFGLKIRCWQTLCVLSKHVSSSIIDAVSKRLWKAMLVPHLPAVRHYLEIFGMRMVMRFPVLTLKTHVLPLLNNFNLTPQVGASLLLVCGYAMHYHLEQTLASDHELCELILEGILPWLNASHGHTRVLVQFLLGVLLPRYLHQQHSKQTTMIDLKFLQQTAKYLSENKDTKRMHRRQAKQLETFHPEFESSLLGILSSSVLNEFQELFPREDVLVFSSQMKETINELFAQYQREHFSNDMALNSKTTAEAAQAKLAATTTAPLNIQRKIDTNPILLLDDSVLPVAMQDRDEKLPDLNIRNKKRQQVILCASLVDKIPNLAGLARTCEIFNAQKLVVPNLRVCEDDMFATISVTANKWMPIEEVKPNSDDLLIALQRWKSEGYVIVAVEQTASSVCLSTYQFPEKMVIVLGKEREGIPVDILQIVDVCVEIPQFGLIRSLNVHVSGAILLWEYTQQQMLR